MLETWRVWAQKDPAPFEGREFFHFGAQQWVRMCYGGNVVEVDLTEDPQGMYWGWHGTDAAAPTMVQPSRAQYDIQFPYGPAAEQTAGKGRTVRLRVEEVPDGTHP